MTLFNSQLILLAALSLTVFYLIKMLVDGFRNPLSHVPGPWHTRFTNLGTLHSHFFGYNRDYIDELHHRYGPVIRVSFNGVAVLDHDVFDIVMRKAGNKYLKAAPIAATSFEGYHNLFSLIDPKVHAVRRRLYAIQFSKSWLRRNWEPKIRAMADQVVAKIKRDASAGRADVYKLWRYLSADTISALSFGESFQMTENEKESEFLEAMDRWAVKIGMCLMFPCIDTVGRLIPFESVRKFWGASNVMFSIASGAAESARQTGQKTRVSLFSEALAVAGDESKAGLEEGEIKSDAAILMFAGTDTTSTSLTYIVWCLLKHPDIRKQVEEEVLALGHGFDDAVLEKLPLLNGVIYETLRLYGPANEPLLRTVPAGGIVVQDIYLPPGTWIQSNLHTYHRIPTVFVNPERWDPARWLDPTHMMKRSWLPFGAGSRGCIGVHLAWIELRLGTALFLRECQGARIADTTTDEGMKQISRFTMQPRAETCEITMAKA